jgi:hypothetical protein
MSDIPGLEDIVAASHDLGIVLTGRVYALVGGAACVLLGSDRGTTDVDFVVTKGQTIATRATLRLADGFTVEAGTLHTYYTKSRVPVEIEILTPPVLFREQFDEDTPTILVDGVRILKPALILNAKCQSILGRATEEKKESDKDDILFLLKYLANEDIRPERDEVPNATKEFFSWFTETFGGSETWVAAGYNIADGKYWPAFPFPSFPPLTIMT